MSADVVCAAAVMLRAGDNGGQPLQHGAVGARHKPHPQGAAPRPRAALRALSWGAHVAGKRKDMYAMRFGSTCVCDKVVQRQCLIPNLFQVLILPLRARPPSRHSRRPSPTRRPPGRATCRSCCTATGATRPATRRPRQRPQQPPGPRPWARACCGHVCRLWCRCMWAGRGSGWCWWAAGRGWATGTCRAACS